MHNHSPESWTPKVVKMIALKSEGVEELFENIQLHLAQAKNKNRALLYAEKAYQLIQIRRMKNVDKKALLKSIETKLNDAEFNLYKIIDELENKYV